MSAQRCWMSALVGLCAVGSAGQAAIIPMELATMTAGAQLDLHGGPTASAYGLFDAPLLEGCVLTVDQPEAPEEAMRDLALLPASEMEAWCTGDVLGAPGSMTEPDPETFGPLGGLGDEAPIAPREATPLPGTEMVGQPR